MSAGLRFTEQMRGHVAFGETDFERGARIGREDRTTLTFRLHIEIADVDAFLADPNHRANATGWVRCEALGGRHDVEWGSFNLFVDDARGVGKQMLYRMHFRDGLGRPLTLSGHKVVRNDWGPDLWPDTSTLYTRILRGHVGPQEDESAEVVASGVLRITPRGFLTLLTTVRHTAPSVRAGAAGILRFALSFMRQLVAVYGRRPRG